MFQASNIEVDVYCTQFSSNLSDLGVLLAKNTTFAEHIKKVSNKAQSIAQPLCGLYAKREWAKTDETQTYMQRSLAAKDVCRTGLDRESITSCVKAGNDANVAHVEIDIGLPHSFNGIASGLSSNTFH